MEQVQGDKACASGLSEAPESDSKSCKSEASKLG